MTTDIRTLISSDGAKKQIAAVLPKHMTADRQVRIVLSALNKRPKLAKCTQTSLIEAMMTCSELGLEPNDRHAYLIPYGTKCTLIVGYKGLVELAYRSGEVSSIEAEVVYEGDKFDYQTCEHVAWAWLPKDTRPEVRGDCIGAFCVVTMKDGAVHRTRMSADEVNAIKTRSRAGNDGPWVTDWDEMAKKTVFRRASKWIPQSSHVQRALDRDFDGIDEYDARAAQTPVTALGDQVADKVSSMLPEPLEEATEPQQP